MDKKNVMLSGGAKQSQPQLSNPMTGGGSKKKTPKAPFLRRRLLWGMVVALVGLVLVVGGAFALLWQSSSSPHAHGSESNYLKKQQPQQQPLRVEQHKAQQPPPNTLVLQTDKHGDIRITLRRDLSPESVEYIQEIVANGGKCERCKFYRNEKGLLLQGVIADPTVTPNKVLGKCPDDETVPHTLECPAHDKKCGCHGPIMERGMVGWAGGGGGPDFFLVTLRKPADFWDHWHTVWGVLEDASLAMIDAIHLLPTRNQGGMMMLAETIPFTPKLEEGEEL